MAIHKAKTGTTTRWRRLFFLLPAVSLATVLLSHAAPSGASILSSAQTSVGKEMWKGFGLPSGTLGCAAALSNVLAKAGMQGIRSPLVVSVRRQMLQKNGAREIWLKENSADPVSNEKLRQLVKPGDVLFAFAEAPTKLNGGPNAHCGIMSTATDVYTNDWNDGIWKEVNIHKMFDFYKYVSVVRIESSSERKQ